jgi:Transposase, Mutator family
LLKSALVRRWRSRHENEYHKKLQRNRLKERFFLGTIGSIPWKPRTRMRGFIEELLETELDAALGRDRYARLAETCGGGRAVKRAGYRHGHRERQLMGTFGPATVRVPRARLETSEGKTVEWKNATIPAYQRRTKLADVLIAGAYLAGTNTRRVRRALAALFGGAVGKDTVSRVWRKVKGDWDWNALEGRANHQAHSRRHSGAGAARQEGHVDFASRGAGRPARRPESSAGGQEHGRRERGGLAGAPR